MRLVLIAATTSYNADAFLAAARGLGAEVILATDRCHMLDGEYAFPDDSLVIDLLDPDAATRTIVDAIAGRPVRAVIAAGGEAAVLVAAMAARALGLPHNAVEAAAAARNKRTMRELLAAAGVASPRFVVTDLDEPAAEVATRVEAWPVVVKPLLLSGSRGVIRADDAETLAAALARLRALLGRPELLALDPTASREILVEAFVPGPEVALEGMLEHGALRTLALFDKPDPLDGPFFEETIYVTPSRHAPAVQAAVHATVAAAARALGLTDGPVHAELRLGDVPVVIEVAARSIGGLCSRMLRFGTGRSLEEVLVRHALGEPVDTVEREAAAAGVMMIPIPSAGVLKAVDGIADAEAVPAITEVVISETLERELVPLPEGSSYLGFLFARADTPAAVEAALRAAHQRLRFTIVPTLPVSHSR